jgi:hypothetical protein
MRSRQRFWPPRVTSAPFGEMRLLFKLADGREATITLATWEKTGMPMEAVLALVETWRATKAPVIAMGIPVFH